MKKTNVPIEMNQEQVKKLLKFIDASQPEAVKASIFSQLGHECFTCRNVDAWIGKFDGNLQALMDWVNIEKASKYWERLEFNEDHSAINLTGKRVEGCACAFADCSRPPRSLCHYCCKRFQEEIFGSLLGQQVAVEITEAFLLGGERCSTRIHLI
jgi:hypothetical protein